MQIAFLMQATGAVYGAERATLDLAQRMAAEPGQRVVIWLLNETRVPDAALAVTEAAGRRGLKVLSWPVKRAVEPGVIKLLRSALSAQGVDVLHTIGYKADGYGGWATDWGRRVPWVSTIHGWLFRPDWKERAYGRLNLWMLRRATRVIVLSRWYESFGQANGLHPPQLVRIPTGHAAPDRLPPAPESTPFTVGYLGRLSYEKNPLGFVQMAALLRARAPDRYRFRIAGTGPEEPRVRAAMASSLNGAGAITLEGYCAQSTFFPALHCLCVPSRMENMPYSLLEAMAYGVVPVASSVGGIPDLIEDGVTGFLVPSDEPETMAERVAWLADHPQARQAMAQAGLERLREHFLPDHNTAAHCKLYADMVTTP